MDTISYFISASIIFFFIGIHIRRYVERTKNKSLVPLRKLSDVKSGEKIMATISFQNKDASGIVSTFYQNSHIDVLNNNPVDRKMFVRVWWQNDGEQEKRYTDRVYPYTDELFRHFSTLNPV